MLTHFDRDGKAIMVDVTEKKSTERIALATGTITMNKETFQVVKNGNAKKGDVLGVARVAGIMGSKKTGELIPMCHPLFLTGCKIDFHLDEENNSIDVKCEVKTYGQTGVEMEALTGVNIALLTIYDMCKAMDKRMTISNIHLESKIGGKSGEFKY
ncbi:cyclic pyranopterin monophosphate synthase subunit MoaC [Cetobacterium ceti]|uniref:Cyclic pyranopterin monophosphate synthase n=1 Tax=Cetobacterium ceti TaxID=180163 RepID=A0A1T4M2Q7_9FUSO|nr:cyclic pyranopterin monophosphate synthase MoaC [Cetobacterium ceti]SJZ61058.1 cyclic pyranopterin monophosphate synthase subunit MoaC [Cetobacterium ceti]